MMEKDFQSEEKQIIVTASYYEQKYFMNPQFASLPKEIQKELIQISILFAQKIRCIFIIGFDKGGHIFLETRSIPNDFDFDEIGGELEIKKLQQEKQELWSALEYWYQWIEWKQK